VTLNDHELIADSRIKLILNNNEHVDFSWGEYYAIGTPAYWIDQTKQWPDQVIFSSHESLADELVFCLLGGHGISAELNIAAYFKMKDAGLISTDPVPSEEDIEALLRTPLEIMEGKKPVRYRFPVQKSRRINGALKVFSAEVPPRNPLELREWLLKISGIGFKTASWIVRNFLRSDDVAIIDIHIQRAGIAAGFFKKIWKLPKDYKLFEEAFLNYAMLGKVSPSVLDICIWKQMRTFGRHAQSLLPRGR